MTFVLSPDMLTDIEELDCEHRAILLSVRGLHRELESFPLGEGAAAVERLRGVIEEMWDHMVREEHSLARMHDTAELDISGHVACHDVFRRWSGDFLDFLTAHPDVVAVTRCAGFLERWYVRHLSEEDGRIRQGIPLVPRI